MEYSSCNLNSMLYQIPRTQVYFSLDGTDPGPGGGGGGSAPAAEVTPGGGR